MSCGCGCGGACGGGCGDRCGCCEGTRALTPRDVFNRPGLPVLRRRVGDHHAFLETMRAAIASTGVDYDTGAVDAHGRARRARRFPLRALRTRDPADPTLALLDLWATVADVLTFYTERIAQEGYLRTATELRSVAELARLVGYRRRPGVSASAYLAFTVDDAWTAPIAIPAGARVQSLPGPGETPVFFETEAALTADARFNVLLPRRRRPLHLPFEEAATTGALWLAGTATRLTAGSALLLSYGDKAGAQVLRLAAAVTEDFDAGRTEVALQPTDGRLLLRRARLADEVGLDRVLAELEQPPSRPPAAPARLALSPAQAFGPGSPAVDRLIERFHPAAAGTLAAARAAAPVTPAPALQSISALRVRGAMYGHNALPPQDDGGVIGLAAARDWFYIAPDVEDEDPANVIDLDTTYDAIVPGTWVVIRRPGVGDELNDNPPLRRVTLITRVLATETVSRTDYAHPATVTRLTLEDRWLPENAELSLGPLRSTVVLAAPEVLAPVDAPIGDPVCGGEIELDRQVDGLEPGRWVVVAGERAVTDAFATPGVPFSEVTMLAGVRQDVARVGDGEDAVPLPGDRIHTFLELATPLAYCYARDTLRILANVAPATHGETRAEPLGSGDPANAPQSFALKSAPLTYVPAPTTAGVRSTLDVRVNGERWHEADDLHDLGPADRGYVTAIDHLQQTTVLTGDGTHGARLPAGVENVRATYRSGIGRAGNVRAGQLSLLVAHTDGLRSVANPQRASGGADADGVESTRARAPLAVSALDRLVSVRDYADFALTFAGVAKATATRLPARGGSLVHVTVAGEDDAPIDPGSELAASLLEALRRYGDPSLPVAVAQRELLALVVAARVRLDADHRWETVRPQLEAALRARFGFAARDLAQDAYAAQAIAALQAVAGVDAVDLDLFAAVPESATTDALAALATTLALSPRLAAAPAAPGAPPAPAQLLVLVESAPSTIMLTEIER